MPALSTALASLEPATWQTLGVVVAGLALTHFVLSWSIKHKARHQPEQQQPQETGTQRAVRRWIWQGAIRCIPPLAVLIWVNGLHFALVAVANDLEEYSFTPAAIEALDWLQGIGMLLSITWLLIRIGKTIDQALRSIAARTDNDWSEILVPFAGRAVRLVLPLIAILLGAPALAVSPQTEMIVRYAISLLVIATLAYLALQVINVGTMLVLHGQQLSVSDNRRARVIYTQVTMLRKIVNSVVA